MKQTFFKTLIATALVSSFSIALFLSLTMVFYKNPLNSVPKSFDWLFFLGFPIWAMLYYKLKVNNKTLIFQEGLVMGALVSFSMILTMFICIFISYSINQNILIEHRAFWVKKILDKTVSIEQNKEKVLEIYQNLSIWQYLFQEIGFKMILLFLVSVVGATAFRGEPKPVITKKTKK
ncbi:MAG: hypothetical protein MUC49_08370 [Raineya sp.]|jgi:hypothetical protein|nr:hypothetical protein [Raineya sp.]